MGEYSSWWDTNVQRFGDEYLSVVRFDPKLHTPKQVMLAVLQAELNLETIL